MPVRLARSGGGLGKSTRGDYGIVIEEAEANLATAGRFIPIDADATPLMADGEAFTYDVTDSEAEGYDEGDIDAAAIEFYSAHVYAPCAVGTRIRLTLQSTFRNDAPDKTPKWWGRMVDVLDYLMTRPGCAPATSLVGADEAADIDFAGTPCSEES
jgi:hypothetical protein